jgi:Gas vesicle synthesis protein GvpL/GvpF
MAVNGLRLYGVAALAHADARPLVDSTSIVALRDIGAIVRSSAYTIPPLDDNEMLECERVVESVFRAQTILPAPCGTVFKSEDHVRRWLELNYVSLVEGIHFVEGRCEARVHATAAPGEDGEAPEIDTEALASESFRHLRRYAVAALPLRPEEGRLMSAAFLVDRAEYSSFDIRVKEQARAATLLRFQLTGPWPPYDFVRLDFGV